MLVMFSTAVPLFVMVTFFVGEGLPISTAENYRLVGLNDTEGPVTA